jgi:hypothetical protein
MENLSPAALSTLKRELEKRVNSAMLKSRKLKICQFQPNLLVNETEILNDDEKKFKHALLTMFVDELKGAVRKKQTAVFKPFKIQ